MKCFAGNVIEVKLFSIITGAKCTECGYNCHERCQPQVPWQCKKPDVLEQPGSGVTKSTLSLPSEVSSCFRIVLFIFASRFVFMMWAKSWTNQDCSMMKLTYPQCYFNVIFHADWRHWANKETSLWPSLQKRASFTSMEGQMVCSGHAKKSGI